MSKWKIYLLSQAVVMVALSGCATVSYDSVFGRSGDDEPKKLLTWAVGPEEKKNGNGDDKKNGNGDDGKAERDIIATDRPDFVEASSAVGRGRVQLEAGYTYVRDNSAGTRVVSHSYPEALLRIGMFADWFEFRIGQNLGSEHDSGVGHGIHGASDLYLGCRFDLAEQKGIFPETSLILQTSVPTGHNSFTARQMLPGFNLLYGWDIIEERLTLGGSTQVNRRVDDSSHYYAEYAQAFTVGYKWTQRFGQYTEWFGLIPCGATSADARTQHYLDGGFTYLITDNFQVDIRAGIGLNRAANDFFAGTGFGIRY